MCTEIQSMQWDLIGRLKYWELVLGSGLFLRSSKLEILWTVALCMYQRLYWNHAIVFGFFQPRKLSEAF